MKVPSLGCFAPGWCLGLCQLSPHLRNVLTRSSSSSHWKTGGEGLLIPTNWGLEWPVDLELLPEAPNFAKLRRSGVLFGFRSPQVGNTWVWQVLQIWAAWVGGAKGCVCECRAGKPHSRALRNLGWRGRDGCELWRTWLSAGFTVLCYKASLLPDLGEIRAGKGSSLEVSEKNMLDLCQVWELTALYLHPRERFLMRTAGTGGVGWACATQPSRREAPTALSGFLTAPEAEVWDQGVKASALSLSLGLKNSCHIVTISSHACVLISPSIMTPVWLN
jgi:hypothetical protein